MEQIKLSQTEYWLPGASIWVTTLEPENHWRFIFDYKLNFQISRLLQLVTPAQSQSKSEFKPQSLNLNKKRGELLMVTPHGMLPTELVVLLESWDRLEQIQKIHYPYQSTIVRLFDADPKISISQSLTSRFQFEMVYRDE